MSSPTRAVVPPSVMPWRPAVPKIAPTMPLTMPLRMRPAPRAASQPNTTLSQLVPLSSSSGVYPEARPVRASRSSTLRAPVFPSLRSEEHTPELQSRQYLVCRLLLEKKNQHRPCSILSSIASCVFHYALPSNRFPTTWIAKADQPTPTELLNVMTRGLMLDFPQLERT